MPKQISQEMIETWKYQLNLWEKGENSYSELWYDSEDRIKSKIESSGTVRDIGEKYGA